MSEYPLIKSSHAGLNYFKIGTGTPLLLIHGTPGDGRQMLQEFGWLADEGFQLVAPCRPGYFGTALSLGKSMEAQAECMATLMDHLGFDHYGVLAWSGGGPAAIYLAQSYPLAVRALVLQSCVMMPCVSSSEERKMMWVLSRPLLSRLLKLMAVVRPNKLFENMIVSDLGCSNSEVKLIAKQLLERDSRLLQYAKKMFTDLVPHSNHKIGYQNDSKIFSDLAPLPLSELKMPCLISYGLKDKMLTREHAVLANKEIPNSVLLEYENMGHMPKLSLQYVELKQKLLDFLNAHVN